MPRGATLHELQDAAPNWAPASVISALYYDVRGKGYGIRTVVMTPRDAHNDGHEASVAHLLGTERTRRSCPCAT